MVFSSCSRVFHVNLMFSFLLFNMSILHGAQCFVVLIVSIYEPHPCGWVSDGCVYEDTTLVENRNLWQVITSRLVFFSQSITCSIGGGSKVHIWKD